MTNFEILLLTHFVMDWIFQTEWQAANKFTNWRALLSHTGFYVLGFSVVFYFLRLNFWWLALIFVSHVIIDRGKIIVWILKIKGARKEKMPDYFWQGLSWVIDQILHVLILTVILLKG